MYALARAAVYPGRSLWRFLFYSHPSARATDVVGEEGGRTLPAAPLTELVVCPPASSLVSWFDPAFFFTLALQYVREEFKAHKEVPPAQADAFMKTWQEYWVHLARSRVRYAGERVRTVCSRDELPRDGLLGSAVCAWFLRRVLELTGAVVTDFSTALLVHSVAVGCFSAVGMAHFFFFCRVMPSVVISTRTPRRRCRRSRRPSWTSWPSRRGPLRGGGKTRPVLPTMASERGWACTGAL